MDPKVVLLITWTLAAIVVGAYIWFVVWRFRVDRRKKAAQDVEATAMSERIERTVQRMTASAPPAPSPTDSPPTSPTTFPVEERTVAASVAGISLPNDLAPLTELAPRSGAGDRVAFWTDRAPAEIVGPAFADELERLGYTVSSLDERMLSAVRGDDRLSVAIHPDGRDATIAGQTAFTSVPENSVVIEVWVPG
jgi:hypothetical protein